MVGLNLPVVPMAHLYIITKPIEGMGHDFPTLRDPDLLVYWREEVGGLVTGGYERNPAPFGLNGHPPRLQVSTSASRLGALHPADGELHQTRARRGKRRSHQAC